MRLLGTSHIGPTLMVTLIGFLMAQSSGSLGSALGIALTIFTGQLCIGWTNDLVDIESDRSQGRKNKPLANGTVSVGTVRVATGISLTACILLSLFGPFGIRGGSLHLLGVSCGIAYNFHFKKSVLSPLPYVIAFAAFPSAIALSKNHPVPLWLVILGALFGVAAHFANVVKDMERDRRVGLYGLPQRLGTRASLVIAGTSLLIIAVTLASHTHIWFPIPLSIITVFLLFFAPPRYCFPLVMVLALVDVALMVSRISL
ncbi:MAG TPA: UbiA family prenyltransferase [Candidatus Nanopelagicaceae bacterium]